MLEFQTKSQCHGICQVLLRFAYIFGNSLGFGREVMYVSVLSESKTKEKACLYHAGRFIYVNKTDQGELFGSDKNDSDITMYIENAQLSPKHAEIRFNEQTWQSAIAKHMNNEYSFANKKRILICKARSLHSCINMKIFISLFITLFQSLTSV